MRGNKAQQLNLFIKLLWETLKPTCLSTDLRLCICTSHQSWRLVASSSTALWAATYTWLCPLLCCSTLQATRFKENPKNLILTASLQIRTSTKESGWWEFSSKFSYFHQFCLIENIVWTFYLELYWASAISSLLSDPFRFRLKSFFSQRKASHFNLLFYLFRKIIFVLVFDYSIVL